MRTEISDYDLYAQLKQRLEAANCFAPSRFVNSLRLILVVGILPWLFLLLFFEPEQPYWAFILFCISFLTLHCAFLAHEAYHGTLALGARLNERLGRFLMTGIGGVSYEMFYRVDHRAHHAYCGDTERDPELDIKLFAFDSKAARKKRSDLMHLIMRYQQLLFFPLASFAAFFHRARTLAFLLRHPFCNKSELAWLATHYLVWLGIPAFALGAKTSAVNYLICGWMTGLLVAAVFPFFHLGRQTFHGTSERSVFTRNIRTTRNLGDSVPIELLTGGNNNHIEHHLFPGIPVPRLPKARRITRQFCLENGLEYHEVNHWRAAGEILAFLKDVVKRESLGS